MHENRHLTAEEVRRLPLGTLIDIHGRDRHGYSTTTRCSIVQRGKAKRLMPLGLYADRSIPITKREGAIHYYTSPEVE